MQTKNQSSQERIIFSGRPVDRTNQIETGGASFRSVHKIMKMDGKTMTSIKMTELRMKICDFLNVIDGDSETNGNTSRPVFCSIVQCVLYLY